MKDFEASAEPLQECLNATELAVQESSTRLHDLTAKKQELHKLQVLVSAEFGTPLMFKTTRANATATQCLSASMTSCHLQISPFQLYCSVLALLLLCFRKHCQQLILTASCFYNLSALLPSPVLNSVYHILILALFVKLLSGLMCKIV